MVVRRLVDDDVSAEEDDSDASSEIGEDCSMVFSRRCVVDDGEDGCDEEREEDAVASDGEDET